MPDNFKIEKHILLYQTRANIIHDQWSYASTIFFCRYYTDRQNVSA